MAVACRLSVAKGLSAAGLRILASCVDIAFRGGDWPSGTGVEIHSVWGTKLVLSRINNKWETWEGLDVVGQWCS